MPLDIDPSNHLEVLAKIRHVLLPNRIGPAIPALVGHPRVVAHAIETNFEIRAALMARVTPPWLARQRPIPSALVAMACHGRSLRRRRDDRKLELRSGYRGRAFISCR